MLDSLLGSGEPFALLLRGSVWEGSVCAAPGHEHEQAGGGIEETELIIGLGLVFTVRVCADAVRARRAADTTGSRILTFGRTI